MKYVGMPAGMVKLAVDNNALNALYFYPKPVQERVYELGLTDRETVAKKRKRFMRLMRSEKLRRESILRIKQTVWRISDLLRRRRSFLNFCICAPVPQRRPPHQRDCSTK